MKYTFLPWLRHGIANEMAVKTTGSRAYLDLKMEVSSDKGGIFSVSPQLDFAGPGDVVGINERLAVCRLHPLPGSTDFAPNLLPFVEFYEEDFPWRHTPVRPDAQGQLLPWLTLFLLKEGEFGTKTVAGRPLPTVEVKAGCPMLAVPADQGWGWAHVQVNLDWSANAANATKLAEQMTAQLATNPDAAFSRLLGPRKLEPLQAYHAFLVPTFESGRQAGLGLPVAVGGPLEAAWKTGETAAREFPYYLRWSFSTAAAGDFETLARKVKPNVKAAVELPRMDVRSLHALSTETDSAKLTPVVELPVLLMPPAQKAAAWPALPGDAPIKKALADRLNKVSAPAPAPSGGHPNLAADPTIDLLPAYGAAYLATAATMFDPAGSGWPNALNLDPRFRALANLGAEAVRQNRGLFLEKAWLQAMPHELPNARFRCAHLAAAVTPRLLQKHLPGITAAGGQGADNVQDLAVLRPVHSRVTATVTVVGTSDSKTATVSALIAETKLTPAATDPAMRRLLVFGNRLKKVQVGFKAPLPGEVMAKLNGNVSAGPAKGSLYPTSPPALAFDAQKASEAARMTRMAKPEAYAPAVNPTAVTSLTSGLYNELAPDKTVAARVRDEFKLPPGGLRQTPAPAFESKEPMFDLFKKTAPGFLTPQLKELPDNSASVLTVNFELMETLLLGANHEMSRLLAWQKFPGEQRVTWFKNFWDTNDSSTAGSAEIKDMQGWAAASPLGDAAHRPPAAAPGLFLLLRGELFRKFPQAVVLARKARFKPGTTEPVLDAPEQWPLTRGQFDPDIIALSFGLTAAQARGNGTTDPGWFFCFTERPGQLQLGLDESGPAAPVKPDDLAWNQFGKGYLDPTVGFAGWQMASPSPIWGKDAANIAGALVQKPVMLAVHASALIPS